MTIQSYHEPLLLERYSKIRDENKVSVAKNEVDIDTIWGEHCFAYNVQILLPPPIQAVLAELQENICGQEVGHLWRTPAHSLHISVGSLIAVRAGGRRQDKETQWQAIRHTSEVALVRIAKETRAFQVRFCAVMATRGAIIAVATDYGCMQTIREKLCAYIPLDSSPIDIIHSTLFRYQAPLADPQAMLAKLQTLCLDQTFIVNELHVRREKVYPSLDSDLVFTVKLSGARSLNQK